MALKSLNELQNSIANIDKNILYITICKNIKKYRLEKYNQFKNQNFNNINTINPFSTEKIAELLDYNHNHYKRFESENDSTKQIPFDKLVKLSIILDKTLDDFLK